MKKRHLLSLVAVAGTSFVGVSEVQAEDKTTTTTGEAGFAINTTEEATIVRPGDNHRVQPDSPSTQLYNNGVRLSYVPNFYFGSNNELSISNSVTTYAVKNDIYTLVEEKGEKIQIDDGNGGKKDAVMETPQFVQVADISGGDVVKWSVSVSQNDVFKTPASGTAAAHSLTNTRIKIKGQTLTNNRERENNIQGILAFGGTEPATEISIPVANASETAIDVLSKKQLAEGAKPDSTTTNGSKSSVVFNGSYNHETTPIESQAAVSKIVTDEDGNSQTVLDIDNRQTNDDVVLSVPETDTALAAKYTATLTWTLTASV